MRCKALVGFEKCSYISTTTYHTDIFTTLEVSWVSTYFNSYLLPFESLPTTGSFYSKTVTSYLAFSRMLYNCNLMYVVFSDWLLSLNNMHLSFTRVFLWLDSSFLFSKIIFHCLDVPQFVLFYSAIEEQLERALVWGSYK